MIKTKTVSLVDNKLKIDIPSTSRLICVTATCFANVNQDYLSIFSSEPTDIETPIESLVDILICAPVGKKELYSVSLPEVWFYSDLLSGGSILINVMYEV